MKLLHTSARYTKTGWGFGRSSSSYQQTLHFSHTDNLNSSINEANIKNNKTFSFSKCSQKTCKTCPLASDSQTNFDGKRKFCKVFNCIYRLSCNICNLSYIGQTSNPLHLRINVHRNHVKSTAINNSPQSPHNNFEYTHFHIHGFDNITISILDIIPNTQDRLYYENQYMLLHKTLFPYGLNQIYNHQNLVKSNFNNPNNQSIIYPILFYNSKSASLGRFKRGKRKNKNKNHSDQSFRNNIKKLHDQFTNNSNWNCVKTWLFANKKKHINRIYNIFINLSFSNLHFKHLFYDLLLHRSKYFSIALNISSYSNLNSCSNNPNSYCTISFTNSILNSINFNDLFSKFSHLLPVNNINIKKVFKFNMPIGRKIFNYNQVSKSISLVESSSNLTPCICSNPSYSNFVNSHHGHIITGDLNIVESPILKHLMLKGTKYRLPMYFNFKSILRTLAMDLDKFIYSIAFKYNAPLESFNMWKFSILNNIKQSPSNISYPININFKSLQNDILKLQDNFVICYIDKAASNYALICKQFYIKLLKNTLHNTSLYKSIKDNSTIIAKRLIAKYKLLKLKFTNIKFPYLVLIPKFHKSPIKFRSVTSAHNTYATLANKRLLEMLVKLNKSINSNCIINNSFELVKDLKNIPLIYGFKTFDFQNLFDSINTHDLFNVICNLFSQFIVSKNLPQTQLQYFSKLLKFVLFENYIHQLNSIYKQQFGIPQGACSSSMLANLYLYCFELNKINEHFIIRRYIDDLIYIKISPNSDQIIDFYPANLILIANEIEPSKIAKFLDLQLVIENPNKLTISIYDKRKDFKFNINKFPNFSSCLSKNIFRNTIVNELSRIHKLCSNNIIPEFVKELIEICNFNSYPLNYTKSIINRFNFN